jgi:MOSC domain-containing protein
LVSGSVTSITFAPVKGLALTHVDEVELESGGLRENRRFHLIRGDEGTLVNGKVAGTLVQVAAATDRDSTTLSLRFPDGATLEGPVELGAPVETDFWGTPVAGRIVGGAFAEALSTFAGRPLRLVRVNEPGAGSDRGVAGSVSVLSLGALDRLAREAGRDRVDGRRFRMLFGIDGVVPHAEDGWVGRRVAIGGAVIRLRGLVGRCAVTTQDPDTGIPDLATLRLIRHYRSDVETDEPLPFGAWGSVEQPGRVRVGDPVAPV